MCYWTITLDHNSLNEGHKRAIMIVDAKNQREATARFLNTFGPQYYNELNLVEGIHIPAGFDRLLTEQVKKYIVKVKAKSDDLSSLEYSNMINLAYAA